MFGRHIQIKKSATEKAKTLTNRLISDIVEHGTVLDLSQKEFDEFYDQTLIGVLQNVVDALKIRPEDV